MTTATSGGRIAGGVAITVFSDTKITRGLAVELCAPYKVRVPAASGSRNIIGQVVTPARIDGADMAVETRGKAVQVMPSGAALASCGPVIIDNAGKVIPFVPGTDVGLSAVNTLLTELRADYIAHCARVGNPKCHEAADAVNNDPIAIASAAQADLILFANSLKAKYNAHDTLVGAVHAAAGADHQVDAPAATDLDSLIYMTNDIKVAYEAHRADAAAHTAADATNTITAPNAAKDFSEPHTDAAIYGWNLTTAGGADVNVDVLVK